MSKKSHKCLVTAPWGDDSTRQRPGPIRTFRHVLGAAVAAAEELEELGALAQAARGRGRVTQHLGGHLGDLGGAEVEALVEVVHRVKDLGVAKVRVVQRRELRA